MQTVLASTAFRRFAPVRVAAALLVAVTIASCAGPDRPDPGLDSLFAAERAFAQHSVREGMRAAFLAHFAHDGVVFWPAPILLHEAFAGSPEPPNPLATTLDWRPIAGGIAGSGEIGFTTGPWIRTDNVGAMPPRHGVFFSIWTKRDGKRWRVVADAGARTATPVSHELLAPAPALGAEGEPDPSALLAAERDVSAARQYGSLFTSDAMLASDATGVLRGDAIAARYREDGTAMRLSTMHASVARSGDIGYTYGAWTLASDTGYYLHLWTRDAKRAWRIAVATHQAKP